MCRRQFLVRMAALPAVLAAPSLRAQGVATGKPTWIIVPWPAGAGTDVATRAVADALARELGQPVQVDNKPGASGAIGSAYVARARADGLTLVTATADTHSINPQVRTDLPYDATGDFVPLVVFGVLNWAWVARADLPVNNMKEFVALAKQKPGQFTYGSWGVGSTAHVAAALLESAAGIQLHHIPYLGAAPALTDLQGGHVDLMPNANQQAADLRAAGKVKILGISAAQRATGLLNDVPTLAEQGIAGAECGSWYGIMAPKGVPEDVRSRLAAALVKVVSLPEVAARIRAAGVDPVAIHGSALKDFLRSEYERYGAVVRARQIKVG